MPVRKVVSFKMKDRADKILSLLTSGSRMEVAELARQLGVSAVTVRKDLDALEVS